MTNTKKRKPEELYESLQKYYETQDKLVIDVTRDIKHLPRKKKKSQDKAYDLVMTMSDELDEKMYMLFDDEPHIKELIQSKEETYPLGLSEGLLQIAEFINYTGKANDEVYTSPQRKQIVDNLTKALELFKGED